MRRTPSTIRRAAPCRLAQHGLSTSGRKADLAARLQAHEAGAAAPTATGPAAASAAPNQGAGFAQGGLMPKGGKRRNFVRMNLKASLLLSMLVPPSWRPPGSTEQS